MCERSVELLFLMLESRIVVVFCMLFIELY